jgi:hypothetical protein
MFLLIFGHSNLTQLCLCLDRFPYMKSFSLLLQNYQIEPNIVGHKLTYPDITQ